MLRAVGPRDYPGTHVNPCWRSPIPAPLPHDDLPLFAQAPRRDAPPAPEAPSAPPQRPRGLAAAAASIAAWADDEPDALPGPDEGELPPELVEDPLRADLRRWFGHDDFRPGQREVIEAVLGGRDALAVLPTGG
ncbi:MAG: hypothetical protein R3F62_28660, partial [Planctomycetota bacterium]